MRSIIDNLKTDRTTPMNNKVKPSELLSKTIENLLSGGQPTEDLLTALLRVAEDEISLMIKYFLKHQFLFYCP